MNKTTRPKFSLETEVQIETQNNQHHAQYWTELAYLQVSLSSVAPFRTLSSGKLAPEPKRPHALTKLLTNYVTTLFTVEASYYPESPALRHWLLKLGERVSGTVLDKLSELEKSGRDLEASLRYHGLSPDEIKKTLSIAVKNAKDNHLVMREQVKGEVAAREASLLTPPAKPRRLTPTIECPSAVPKLDSYIKSKAMTLTEFATKAGTTDRTLRKFRQTGRVKYVIFEGIAKAMGMSKAQLMEP